MKPARDPIAANMEAATPETFSRMGVWMLIAGILLIAASLRAPITAVGPLITAIRDDAGISNTLAGMLTAFPLLAFALLSPLAPQLARRLGMEYTLFISMLVLTAGIALRALPSVTALFMGTALLGMGIALSNVLLPGLIKSKFPHRLGIMTGMYSLSMNIWAAIASGVSVPIAYGLNLGWRGSLGIWGILTACALLVWMPQLRSRRRPAAERAGGRGGLWHSSLAWKVTLFMGLQSMNFYVTISWLPEILSQQGLSQTAAGWMVSLMQLVSLPATFLVPIVAGRFANQRGLVVTIAGFFIAGYIILLSELHSLMPIGVILIGIAGGSAFSLATMFFILRTKSGSQAAELSGMAQTVGYLLAAAGPAFFGFVYDATHHWTIPLLFLLVVGILLLIFGLGAAKEGVVETKG
ncbi:CynX/NimT family MFS transporter [Paenibacillus abyssi]|uniref:Transporter YycB n=1 Tax=Paenibacillus abyssi TaxID=1340531 RepID=A0A917CNZ4_9BACL|nr:MFS transporter [Paenibacillus abyssi]GGF94331.1 putative transporter YycB [Paenibacillus abyssi]